jgi:GNAT superfamily N-acetyltransferase
MIQSCWQAGRAGVAIRLRAISSSSYCGAMIGYRWRARFADPELNDLHAAGFGGERADHDWWAQVTGHSLGWVCAREGPALVGFVNVAWDGAAHAFILDTVVAARVQRQGAGSRLVALAADEARNAGCQWLHADFEDQLRPFYRNCGFPATAAGLMRL